MLVRYDDLPFLKIAVTFVSKGLVGIPKPFKTTSSYTWMSRWKLGSMVGKWDITYL